MTLCWFIINFAYENLSRLQAGKRRTERTTKFPKMETCSKEMLNMNKLKQGTLAETETKPQEMGGPL